MGGEQRRTAANEEAPTGQHRDEQPNRGGEENVAEQEQRGRFVGFGWSPSVQPDERKPRMGSTSIGSEERVIFENLPRTEGGFGYRPSHNQATAPPWFRVTGPRGEPR